MSAIRIHTILDARLLERPELAPLVGHRVELIVREDSDASWPAGWFEAVEGAIDDATFERGAEPPLRSRPALDP